MPKKVIRGLLGDVHVEQAKLDRSSLASLLHATLKDVTLDELVSAFVTPIEATLEYFELQNGGKTCKHMSLLFNPHRLTTATSTHPLSIFEAIKDEKFASGLARAYLAQRKTQKNSPMLQIFYTAIGMGVEGVQYVNEFPPHVARDLALKYGLDATSKVLDPCAGWGGRMIGLSTVVGEYAGFEPATETYRGLRKLRSFLSELQPEFEARVHRMPFEDADLPTNHYDFAITSPPYYDTEHYSDEKTNSLNRYRTFKRWTKGFYIPFLAKTMDALRPGAVFVLNIGSRKYPLSEIMREFCTLHGYKVERVSNSLLSGKGGLGKENSKGEGETFYAIHKTAS